jgi:hypothetical protein
MDMNHTERKISYGVSGITVRYAFLLLSRYHNDECNEESKKRQKKKKIFFKLLIFVCDLSLRQHCRIEYT